MQLLSSREIHPFCTAQIMPQVDYLYGVSKRALFLSVSHALI